MVSEREAFVGFVSRIGKEGGLILLISCCALLLLSLLTFDARDPGWSHLGYDGSVNNLAGPAGAWLADFCFSGLGYFAFAPPLMMIFRALLFLRKRDEGLSRALPFLALRTLGALLVVFAGAALASLHWGNQWLQLPFGAGGMIGMSLADHVLAWFGLVGATFVLLPAWLLGVTLFSDFSWFKAADATGGLVLAVYERLAMQMSRARRHSGPRVDGDNGPAETAERPGVSGRAAALITGTASALAAVRKTDAEAGEGVLKRQEPRFEPTFDQTLHNHTPAAADRPTRHAEVADEPPTGLSPVFDATRFDEASVDQPRFDDRMTDEALVDGALAGELPFDPDLDRNVGKSTAGPGAGERGQTAATSASPAEEKHVKIVPLSETHQPQLGDPESGRGRSVGRRSLPLPAGKKIPSLKLLDKAEDKKGQGYSEEQLESMSRLLEAKLKDFGVVAEVVEVNPGPVITRFEIQPAPGTKVSKISNLAKDLARSMAVLSVRVVEVIAGKSVVGIEIPNDDREMVRLSEVLGSGPYVKAESKLSLGLGNDIAGNPVVVNLAKMPHLLVAGTTGSGKSVGVNAMLLSLLFKATPDEVRLMMVDPKMLELSIYDGIPHLLTPVITDMKEAAGGLRWCVAEMERRYRLMAKLGVRNLAGFNDKLRSARAGGEPILDPLWNPLEEGFDESAPAPALETLPYIVVVIDEFADMMMIVGKKVEELIARIAQKARAAGIHLVLATQRPSVDVITGLIKANVPTRIAFQVSSKIDSRTILDQSGAENLLGNGDMLYLPAGSSMPVRVHGAFVDDDEVHRVVEAWKKWGPAEFIEEILMANVDADTTGGGGSMFEEDADALYDEAVAFVTESRRASISAVQRKLKIGYNRAARMVESMEAAGVVSEAGHNGSREVLAPPPVQS